MIDAEHRHHEHHAAGWPPTLQSRLGLLALAVITLGLTATGVVTQIRKTIVGADRKSADLQFVGPK